MAKPSLSRQQKRVLKLMSEGKGRKDVARILQISVETVRGHINIIKQRVDAPAGTDISQLIVIARRRGLLDEPTKREPHIPGRRRNGVR